MKKSIKYVAMGACSLAALLLSACQPTKVSEEVDFADLDPAVIKKNLGVIRDVLPPEDQLIYILNENRSIPVDASQQLNTSTGKQEIFFDRRSYYESVGKAPLIKEKCFSTKPFTGPAYDPKDSNFIVMGVKFTEDGTLVRSFLSPVNDRLDIGSLHNLQPFDLNNIQSALADIALNRPEVFEDGGTAVSGNKPVPPSIERPRSNGRSLDIRQTAPNGRTPFFNRVGKNAGEDEIKNYVMHFVMLNENMKFTEQDSFTPLSGFATKYYSPFYDYIPFRSGTGEKPNADDLKVLSVWYYRGGDIGKGPNRTIQPNEKCYYPYDFKLTSVFDDKKGMPGALNLITPIIVDPGSEDKGPP